MTYSSRRQAALVRFIKGNIFIVSNTPPSYKARHAERRGQGVGGGGGGGGVQGGVHGCDWACYGSRVSRF